MPLKTAIIVPCYNEEGVVEDSMPYLNSLVKRLVYTGKISEDSAIICVDDGSKDRTWNIIENLAATNRYITGIKLSRNVGHQNAILAGISAAADYDVTITIDADLQDDIDIIELMIDKYNEGCEIVYGVRKNRQNDSFFKKQSANIFYNLMKNSGTDVIPNHADFRLMSRKAVSYLLEFRERNLFLRGIVPLIGFKSDMVYYDRKPRLKGNSKYPTVKMIGFAIEGITSFSVRPIRMIFTVGVIFLIITLSVAVYVLISILQGKTYPGWASLMLSIWFIGSLLLISLGIIGEYVSKIYLEVKDRPRFIIEKTTRKPQSL